MSLLRRTPTRRGTIIAIPLFIFFVLIWSRTGQIRSISWLPESDRSTSLDHRLIKEGKGNLAKLEPYFPTTQAWSQSGREDYKHHSDLKLRELAVCLATNTCRENQTSVVIYGHIHAHFHIYNGYMGGEGIWVNSMTESLEKFGYTILHARDDWPYMWYLYNQIPDMAIIAYPGGQYGKMTDFIKTERRTNGIPAWKIFMYNYFPDHYTSIVGDAWNVHSEYGYNGASKNFTFIPYIIEQPEPPLYVPTGRRPFRVYILAKFVSYFYPGTQPAWEDITFFSRAKQELELEFPGFEFVVGCVDERNITERARHPMAVPEGIRNLGRLNKAEFEEQLSNSRALLGIGWPNTSPSPHVALSLGIPFISPYSMWGWSTYEQRDTWAMSQHHTLKALDPPYVYHAERNNYDDFVSSIRGALATPIPRFRFAFMTRAANERAVGDLMAKDWRKAAETILRDRTNGIEHQNGSPELFVM